MLQLKLAHTLEGGEVVKVPAQCFHPGEYVRDEMIARGWDAEKLAEQTPYYTLKEVKQIINCEHDINPRMAFELHRIFDTSVELWINLQLAFNEWKKHKEGR